MLVGAVRVSAKCQTELSELQESKTGGAKPHPSHRDRDRARARPPLKRADLGHPHYRKLCEARRGGKTRGAGSLRASCAGQPRTARSSSLELSTVSDSPLATLQKQPTIYLGSRGYFHYEATRRGQAPGGRKKVRVLTVTCS